MLSPQKNAMCSSAYKMKLIYLLLFVRVKSFHIRCLLASFFCCCWFILITRLFHNNSGTQRPNVSKYVRSVWWFPLCFENYFWSIWSCPINCLSVWMSLGNYGRLEIKVAFSSYSKLLATPMNPVESGSMAGLNSDDYFVSFQLLPRIN